MNRFYLSIVATVLVAAGTPSFFAQSIPDTPANRQREAQRYLQASPPRALFEDMADKMTANMPPSERESFKRNFTSALDIDALTKAMTDAIVKHFTAGEIAALADFYGSPVGKSAMSKFGAYMADLMPALQAEMVKAEAKANQLQPNK